ncbi:hypothetical protein B9S53_11920 [Arthrospira sp. O9.13F]|nr:hypothetical protein B9S53_23130 [Arthrospira sp. O9.13F]RAQ42888.1 hypothetical protein B9S53_11920 [Arthrospira sp. O9.13F]
MESLLVKLLEGAVGGASAEITKFLIETGVARPPLPKSDKSYVLLCVELGHRRCKVAPVEIGVENYIISISLPILEIVPSDPFLGEEGFEAFTKLLVTTQNNSTAKIDGLALSLCCPTNSDKGTIDTAYSLLGWSRNIREVLHQKVGYDHILVVNDAVAFALGCINDGRIINNLKRPALAVTLGVGIGSSLIQKKKPFVIPYEVGNIWKVWENGFEGNPHMLAGQGFFDWASRETNWETEETELNFSWRLAWIINAIREQKSEFQFDSVIIGGGHSAYVDQSEVSRNLQEPCKLSLSRSPEVSLCGAAKLWVDHFHYGQSLSDSVGSSI